MVGQETGKGHIGYNAYDTLTKETYDFPSVMIGQYKVLADRVVNRVKDGQYTHIVIASTGWEHDQAALLIPIISG